MIVDDDNVAGGVVRVHAAASVRDDQELGPESRHHAHGKGDFGQRVTFVGVNASFHGQHVLAAKIATNVGVKCILANGTKSDVLLDIAKGHNPGTEFSEKSKGLVSRKRWIAFGTTSKGKIVVDNGAKEALLNRDCSLLAPGVIKVEGDFQAKDVVSIVDEDHNEFARGITNFSGKLLDETKGKRVKKEVVHRNDLVLLV